jgi:hypothetical protein
LANYVKVTKLRREGLKEHVICVGVFRICCMSVVREMNGRDSGTQIMFTVQWKIEVGWSRVRVKILISPSIMCDVADGMDL